MQVFICDISNVTEAELNNAVAFLSVSEKERLSNMISIKRQREFIVGHYLLRRLLCLRFNRPIEQIKIQAMQSGALMPLDESLGYVSLSHSFDFVAIALSSGPVGLDMEKMRSKNNFNEILEQIDAVKPAGELMKQGCSLQESFFKLWTKREALYKLNSLAPITNKENIPCFYHKYSDFMLCVAGLDTEEVEWKNILFENC